MFPCFPILPDGDRLRFISSTERVAMTATGHRIRSVFDRYHIVSPGDLQDVARRLTGTISSTVTHQTVDARLTRLP